MENCGVSRNIQSSMLTGEHHPSGKIVIWLYLFLIGYTASVMFADAHVRPYL